MIFIAGIIVKDQVIFLGAFLLFSFSAAYAESADALGAAIGELITLPNQKPEPVMMDMHHHAMAHPPNCIYFFNLWFFKSEIK